MAIKPGWKEGTRVIFEGKGDRLPGRPPQDVVFVIKQVPHPRFTRSGDDLTTEVGRLSGVTKHRGRSRMPFPARSEPELPDLDVCQLHSNPDSFNACNGGYNLLIYGSLVTC